MRTLIATALLCLLAFPAHAARHPNGQQFCRGYVTDAGATAFRCWTKAGARHSARSFRGHHRVAHARKHHGRTVARHGSDARPTAWCGWYMRQILGVADQGYNLARKWANWGRPATPAPGVVVVWPHHVGMITGHASGGKWIVKSGNDGHRVRERPRSVARAIAFRAG